MGEGGLPLLLQEFRRSWNMQKFTGIAFILLGLICGIIFYAEDSIGPVNPAAPETVQMTIAQGTGVSQIAKKLERAGLIRNAFYFKALTRLHGLESKLKAGYYEFNTGMSAETVLKKIAAGDVATHKLTIPEGLTVREMAPLVEARTGIPAQQFLQAAREYRPDFLPEYEGEYPVEGFLFPETYQLPYNATAEDLIATMVNEFKQKVGIDGATVRGRNLNIRELITIASCIEEEAKRDEDRAQISGVIYNRLDKNMQLQLCSSVLYVLNTKKDRLSFADTKLDSPYNTYQHRGLPPGPISNPGWKSIEAALHPADVEYLFYLATPDGTTYYARTYAEHLANIRKYLE